MMNRNENYQRYCDERMAQQIRENSQELRALETKIRAVYVNKALRVQLAEKEKQRLMDKVEIANEMELMRKNEAIEREHSKQIKLELRKGQAKQRLELQEQITDKQTKRKILYEEFLKEKIIIDEIMVRIQQEQFE